METKYTKADIISWQNLPEDWEKLIGKEVYYSDSAIKVLDFANTDFEEHKNKLLGFDESKLSFHIAHTVELPWNYIIPVKEPTYEELQAKWIQDNGIKVGSKVRVLNTDQVGEVESIDEFKIDVIFRGKDVSGTGFYSYASLEPVKEEFKVGDCVIYTTRKGDRLAGIIQSINNNSSWVQFNCGSAWCKVERMKLATKCDFVPYDLSKKEIRDKLRGKWIKYADDENPEISEHLISNFRPNKDNGQIVIDIKQSIFEGGVKAYELLYFFTFLDGTPCGELEEAKNAD